MESIAFYKIQLLLLWFLLVSGITYQVQSQSVPLKDGVYLISNQEQKEAITSKLQLSYNAVMMPNVKEQSQLWLFEQKENGSYTIKNQATDRFLEIRGARCSGKANVATWIHATKSSQRFILTKSDNGYQIAPEHCPQMTLSRSLNATGANVQLQYQEQSMTAQTWKLLPVKTNGNKPKKIPSSEIAIFPNPVHDVFSVKGLNFGTEVVLISMDGHIETTSVY